jgi:hypothetical protein
MALVALGSGWQAAWAKDLPLTAIELYDGPTGAAYVQLGDVQINGRTEMRDCSQMGTGGVDKAAYARMGRVILAPGGVLERGSDGVMRYAIGSGSAVCVLPVNARLDRGGAYSLSTLADQALLHGTPVDAGNGTPLVAPPIVKGVKLVFVAAPNLELAEYLRAQRAADMNGWQRYLSSYPASPHTAEAKRAQASLIAAEVAVSLQKYDNSLAAESPEYSELKAAKAKAEKAHSLAPELASVARLDKEIRGRLAAIVEQGRGEVDEYRAALAARAAGYAHLRNARRFSETVTGIDAFFAPGQALAEDVLREGNALEAAMQSANSALAAKQLDQAYAFVLPYRAFEHEEARVAAVVDAVYSYHLEQGNKLEQSEDWAGAVNEFEKAASIRKTEEAQASAQHARQELLTAKDKKAAEMALAGSKDFQAQHNMIRAYELLSSLPVAQQALIADQMKQLEPAYVQSAALEAKNLHQAHSPIRGVADEMGLEKACAYLQKAYQISGNESYNDKLDLDRNELSAYLLEQAKHYLAKPGGSGTELGWAYLEAARQYKASNLDAVRDAIVAASPAHAMRSRLSIRVQFRDQTSQRDSQGIAGQLENAIITGLESSGVPVKVVRAGESSAVDPDFDLAGDVLDHHLSVVPTIEPLESEYRAGEEQIPSEMWNRANRAYEKAQMELQTQQTALQGAEAHGNKDEIKRLNEAVRLAQKSVEGAHITLDATPKTTTRDIIRPYTYHKKIINISGVIQLQFRIGATLGEDRTELVPITRQERKKDVLQEDVKPEDTKGIKSAGSATDAAEFMTALENSARNELIAAVRKRVEELPAKIYLSASSREKEDDLDGAGEFYLRYLDLTHEDSSAERAHAKQFLLESFNMRP